MIRVEKVLEDTFKDVQLEGLDSLKFGYGDEKELDAVILGNKRKQMYPLLWYVMPNSVTIKDPYAEGTFNFILAHNTKLDWFNDQRFNKVYDAVLFPYLDEVIRLLGRSRRIMHNDEYTTTNYPNYSKDLIKSEKPEYWDAIELSIALKINNGNNC